ncbi:MAG: tetratricopeptide repeat protein [Candidatus Electrothrix scaldis]|nr:MAG: tetratricopeptide repeat protein [Candidatus Electrothrix sp. GW3-3]
MFDRNEHHTTELHLKHSGFGDNVGRDKVVHQHLYGSVDYQRLTADIAETEEDLREIPADNIPRRLKKGEKLAALRKQLEDFKADVFRLHELFTRIPINTERLRKAKEHFDKGEFREADALLKAEDIQQDVEQCKARRAAAMETVAAMDQDLAYLANEFLVKARLSLVMPVGEGEERFKQTVGYFEQALAAARTTDILFEYAVFLYEHNAFSKAEVLCQESLEVYRREDEADATTFLSGVAMALNNLAALHQRTQKYGPALKEYKEALKIFRFLVEVEPKKFQSGLALILNNLGELHRVTDNFNLSEGELDEALQLRRIFARENLKEFGSDVAQTLNNLALLHADTQNYDSAQREYKEALELSRSLARIDSNTFIPDVAMILNNLALLYADTQDYSSAMQKYEEALEIRYSLAKVEPKAYLPDVAITLNNLAILYYEIKEYNLALENYKAALQIFRILALDEPKVFLPNVAMALNNLALLHGEAQDIDLALEEFEEALRLYRCLIARKPKTFVRGFVETLLNLSIFYLEVGLDEAKSVEYAQEVQETLRPIIRQVPNLQGYLDAAERLLETIRSTPRNSSTSV